jgi:hypothetical protein
LGFIPSQTRANIVEKKAMEKFFLPLGMNQTVADCRDINFREAEKIANCFKGTRP